MIVRKVKEVKEHDLREAYGQDAEGVTIRWITEKRTGGEEYGHNFALRYFVFQPKGYLGPHKHPWEQEMVITRGRLLMIEEGISQEVKAGEVVYIPVNAEHSFKNLSEEACEFYCIIGCIGEGENCIGITEEP